MALLADMPLIFQASPEAQLVLSPALVIEAVTDAYLLLTGTTRAQLVGQRVLAVFAGEPGSPHATTMHNLRASLEQVLATGQSHRMLVQQYNLPDPTRPDQLVERYWQPTNSPVLGPDGEVRYLLHQVNDITAQVHAEAREQVALEEAGYQRAELRRVLAQAPVAIAIFRGPTHVIELANELHLALWGRSAGQVLGRPLFEALPEAAGLGYEELLGGVLTSGQPYVARELSAPLTRNGQLEQVYFNFVYQPLREADDRITGVVVVASEITEQVLVRQQVEQLNQELEQRVLARTQQLAAQEQVLNRVLMQAPVAIAILRGPELRIELANAAMGLIWGRSPAQTLGQPYFEALPDTAGQGFEEILAGVLATGQPFFVQEAPVTLNRTLTGQLELAYVNFGFHPLYDEHTLIWGLIAVGTEVTEQVRARQQVLDLNQELHTANQSLHTSNFQLTRTNADLDTFVYTASHDLRGPINNIEGLVDALRQELLGGPRKEPGVDHILRLLDDSVKRFQTTIAHLTTVMQAQQSHHQAPPALVNVAALIQDVCLDLAPAIEVTQTQIRVAVTPCPQLRSSPKDLRSIVYNLLSNAIKYRSPDRPPLVEVRTSCTAHWAELHVQDNGLGLSDAQQGKLFKLFERLHPHIEGSGVGLYAINKLVENVGGSIAVASELGTGTLFTVRLPLTSEEYHE